MWIHFRNNVLIKFYKLVNMAGLSEAKIERNERLNEEKTFKQIKYFSAKLTDEFTMENIIVIGDSKVRHLFYEMGDRTFLRMLWRSGANIDNDFLTREADRYITRYNNPGIIAWFGTCELTRVVDKVNKYIDIVPNITNIVDILADKYRAYKHNRMLTKASTRIIFLCVPLYSIFEWNQKKEHPNPSIFLQNQEILEKTVMDLNNVLREINQPHLPPQIVQDMFFNIKRKASQPQTQKINYTLLLDGVHPGKPISKLWLIRVKLFSKKL